MNIQEDAQDTYVKELNYLSNLIIDGYERKVTDDKRKTTSSE
jgi:hypothetical protein